MTARLPLVLATSVVRSSHQGESHGGVYKVDLETGLAEQVIDWNDGSISWEGRGSDRGLRGIAFRGEEVFLAASDEIFVFDRQFRRLRSFRNAYLKHCHEICIDGDRLFMASTGFDSVLEYDLAGQRFVRGTTLRAGLLARALRRVGWPYRPRLSSFDPNGPAGPRRRDTHHINNVSVRDGVLFASGTMIPYLVAIEGGRARVAARIPMGSHNAQPFGDGVLMNHTATESVCVLDGNGVVRERFPVPRYDPSELVHGDVPAAHARQAFGRGLAVHGDLLIAGSSPATISVHDRGTGKTLKSVNLTKDVRNAVHGLEVWPF